MRAVVLHSFDPSPTSLTLESIPVPPLLDGDVLVRIKASPINPSDLVFLRNRYGIKKPVPVVPGFEASGIVVASSGGIYGRSLLGRRVACRAPENRNGSWAEYMACPATDCVPLRKQVSLEQGASLFVNPLTAWAFLDVIRKEKASAIILTAASSAVGKMASRLCRRQGIDVIHVVRRPEAVVALRALGATHVLNSEDPHFASSLQAAAHERKATLAFDSVGGSLTAEVAHAMPDGSKVLVYGALSGRPCEVQPADLIFKNKTVTGFWVTEWIKRKSVFAKAVMFYKMQALLGTDLATTVLKKVSLENVHEAIDFYKKNRGDGKILLVP